MTSYGAVPNDGKSDTLAINDAIAAARAAGGGFVSFAPGQYDVNVDGEEPKSFYIRGSNIVIKGSGAKGAEHGGTTIKMHNSLPNDNFLFETGWKGGGPKSRVSGSFPRGSKFFDLEDTSHLAGRSYIRIRAGELVGSDWASHSSRPISDMPSEYEKNQERYLCI